MNLHNAIKNEKIKEYNSEKTFILETSMRYTCILFT